MTNCSRAHLGVARHLIVFVNEVLPWQIVSWQAIVSMVSGNGMSQSCYVQVCPEAPAVEKSRPHDDSTSVLRMALPRRELEMLTGGPEVDLEASVP